MILESNIFSGLRASFLDEGLEHPLRGGPRPPDAANWMIWRTRSPITAKPTVRVRSRSRNDDRVPPGQPPQWTRGPWRLRQKGRERSAVRKSGPVNRLGHGSYARYCWWVLRSVVFGNRLMLDGVGVGPLDRVRAPRACGRSCCGDIDLTRAGRRRPPPMGPSGPIRGHARPALSTPSWPD